jgi:hypothetical protein
MKKVILTVASMLCIGTALSQVNTLYNTNHPFTFVWSTFDLVNFNCVRVVPSKEGVEVETSQFYGDSIKFFKLSDGSGYVMSHNLQPDSSLVYVFVMPPIPDPCEMADLYSFRHQKSGSAVDLDNHRKWFIRCINKNH